MLISGTAFLRLRTNH
ncbi:erythromycin resistance leader peptide [Corynebacterium striatum]